MDIISNNNKSDFFLNLLENAQKETKEVKLAVAYTDDYYLKKVIDFCRDHKIHLSFFGRVGDYSIGHPVSTQKIQQPPQNKTYGHPVSTSSLKSLIKAKPKVVKKVNIIKDLHSKVYWFLNYGVYIGSANLQRKAWNENIECGLWFGAKEPSYFTIKSELDDFFKKLNEEEIHSMIKELDE